jgi:pyridoxine 5-phosphate synthase
MPTQLSVNLNKIALLRNSRTLGVPSVTRAARMVLDAGANGLTVHPRPDARHIRAQDVTELAALLRDGASTWPDAEFNIEGNPFHGLLEFIREVRPQQCTLVPDESAQFTSDHGWDLPKDSVRLVPIINELKSLGVRVSLFMDPIPEAMSHARTLGADRIELYTEPYAQAFGTATQAAVTQQYADTAKAAQAVGLGVNAGHDLNLENLAYFVQNVPHVAEVSIGHALVADALEFGLDDTVKKYLRALGRKPVGKVGK